MGAVDMALWDIRGKALDLPVYQLLGGPVKESIVPYASLLPTGRTVAEYRASLVAKTIELNGEALERYEVDPEESR